VLPTRTGVGELDFRNGAWRTKVALARVIWTGGVRPQRGPKLLRVRAIPAVGLSSAARSIGANGGDGDTERQRVTEDRLEMNDELEEPMRIVQLGRTGLYIEPDQAGSYLLHGSDGTVIAAPFTRDDAARFARELLRWVQEADLQD
jgi:hypothetical protein